MTAAAARAALSIWVRRMGITFVQLVALVATFAYRRPEAVIQASAAGTAPPVHAGSP